MEVGPEEEQPPQDGPEDVVDEMKLEAAGEEKESEEKEKIVERYVDPIDCVINFQECDPIEVPSPVQEAEPW